MAITREFTLALNRLVDLIMHRSMMIMKRFMSESALSFTQFNLMLQLFHGRTISISELSTHLGISNAAASQAIEQLVIAGHLTRSIDSLDRRVKKLVLTDQGRKLMDGFNGMRSQWIIEKAQDLSPDEMVSIISAVSILIGDERTPLIKK